MGDVRFSGAFGHIDDVAAEYRAKFVGNEGVPEDMVYLGHTVKLLDLDDASETLIRLVGGVVRSMAGRPRERVEPAMRDLSSAMGTLSPEMLLSVVQRLRHRAVERRDHILRRSLGSPEAEPA